MHIHMFTRKSKIKKLLIYSVGSLGDTLIIVPALWAVADNYPEYHKVLLTDYQVGKNYINSSDILAGTGLIDKFCAYPVSNTIFGKIIKPFVLLYLLLKIRFGCYDLLVYLVRAENNPSRVERDRKFFSYAGIKAFVGMDSVVSLPDRLQSNPLVKTKHQSDLILQRLSMSGMVTPSDNQGCMDLLISDEERQRIVNWTLTMPTDGGRCWVAVGPGSKMSSKRWPAERYLDLFQRLINDYDVWPIVFGGLEDKEVGEYLVGQWRRGYVVAGLFDVREAAAALERCRFYVGNDTGTLHLAVAAGIKCVGIYSARDYPGLWYPYGEGHIVLRASVDCEGCMLETCTKNNNQCMTNISVEHVYGVCKEFLS